MIEVVYEQEIETEPLTQTRIVAIDLGLNNLATLSTNLPNHQPKIYNGRRLKAVNQYAKKLTRRSKKLYSNINN
ncbi:MAG: transposase [Okeania sp. SIO2G4]|uniref:transposase n=1 Tax=unclassified Okeania TaxID=2634635 RepID=UPI0013B86423|nr:transposase [Okeania sp. SIO4D6]NEP40601.1 transposase [Okeania sp. SIO2H7]NEP71302.1 transposase [Okeania sp. SIO2G5]NEP92004.1 transposase [Okeania sp. SIO2F5]NEQ89481.1 transposase [Okeania sp. SIO2G4]